MFNVEDYYVAQYSERVGIPQLDLTQPSPKHDGQSPDLDGTFPPTTFDNVSASPKAWRKALNESSAKIDTLKKEIVRLTDLVCRLSGVDKAEVVKDGR